MSYVSEEVNNIKNVFEKIKYRDFSSPGGQVIKNSTYQLATNLIAKFGSLIFTVVIARMLGVEFFGLYTLALSTIVLFSTFSDLGVSVAAITFISKSLGKNKLRKAKTYFKGLLRYKIYLILVCSIFLALSAYFLANIYYNKPIFLALLAGAIYIPIVSLTGYLGSAFGAENNFKPMMIREVIFQGLRFTIVPLAIFFLLKARLVSSVIVASIILTLSFSYFVGLLYLRIIAKSQAPFLRQKAKPLTLKEKQELKKFILPLTVTAMSGMFFGYVDTLMLGHYVDAIHIGYYGAAFGLIGAARAVIGFVASAVLPVFSRVKGKSLDNIFSKTRNFTLIVGVAAAIFTFFAAKYVLMIYGEEYLSATIFLKLFSLLLIITPVATIYNSYFISIRKTKVIAKLLIFSTIVNVILNVAFIKYGLQLGMMEAVIGACVATICSRVVYLTGLWWAKRRI